MSTFKDFLFPSERRRNSRNDAIHFIRSKWKGNEKYKSRICNCAATITMEMTDSKAGLYDSMVLETVFSIKKLFSLCFYQRFLYSRSDTLEEIKASVAVTQTMAVALFHRYYVSEFT